MCALDSQLLKVNPIIKERIWGGRRLSAIDTTKSVEHIGEVYCISAMPNDDCYIENENCTLSTYYRDHQKDFGISIPYFPIRVNLIDAYNDLSIQVHPDSVYAKNQGFRCGLPEAWFILDSGDHYLHLGHSWNSTNDIVTAFQQDTIFQSIKKVAIENDEFYFLPPGSVHAIGKNVLLYEITHQEDITYRLYDFHRKLSDGNERKLHIKQACDVIKIPQSITKQCSIIVKDDLEGTIKILFDEAKIFTVLCITVHKNLVLPDGDFWIITVLQGNGKINNKQVTKYETYILLTKHNKCHVSGNMKLILATYKE